MHGAVTALVEMIHGTGYPHLSTVMRGMPPHLYAVPVIPDARDCSSAITPALPYLESYQNGVRPDFFGLSGLKPSRWIIVELSLLLLAQEQQPKRVAFGRRYLVCRG